jgi:uncharacterized protein with PIN domain
MCQILKQSVPTKKKGRIDAKVTCAKTGKPIVITNQYGMYCEDKCGLEQDKQAEQQCRQFMNDFMRMFPR